MGNIVTQKEQKQLVAMVETTGTQTEAMTQIELRHKLASTLIVGFSIHTAQRYAIVLFLLDLLLAGQSLSPAVQKQIDKRLDTLEQCLDRIEAKTAQKIIQKYQ